MRRLQSCSKSSIERKKPIYLFNHGLCEYLSQNTEPARIAFEEFVRIGAPGATKDKAQSLLEQIGKAVSDEKVEVVVKSEPSGANVFWMSVRVECWVKRHSRFD